MRKKDVEGAKVKAGIMTAALIGQALWETLEHVEDGDNILTAAGKAVETHKKRKAAIEKANEEVVRAERRR